MAWPCSEEKQIHTEWQPILGATKQVKLNAWHSLDVHHSQLCSACSQVPISGLGPDRDHCPRKVPKKARFASQVPKLTNVILNCVLIHWYV